MADMDLVAVGEYLNKVDAEIARGALAAAEIEAIVSADDAGGLEPGLWVGQGVRVLVHARDVDAARKILEPDR